jgi:hypothetical protein
VDDLTGCRHMRHAQELDPLDVADYSNSHRMTRRA